MTDTVKDLDALVPTDKRIKLGGTEYDIPGDIPMEVFIRVNKAGMLEEEDESAAVTEMVVALTDLFAWNYQDTSKEEIVRTAVSRELRKFGVNTISKLLRAIYGADEEAADEGEDPTPDGTTTPS